MSITRSDKILAWVLAGLGVLAAISSVVFGLYEVFRRAVGDLEFCKRAVYQRPSRKDGSEQLVGARPCGSWREPGSWA